jgi:hypothetical protein
MSLIMLTTSRGIAIPTDDLRSFPQPFHTFVGISSWKSLLHSFLSLTFQQYTHTFTRKLNKAVDNQSSVGDVGSNRTERDDVQVTYLTRIRKVSSSNPD